MQVCHPTLEQVQKCLFTFVKCLLLFNVLLLQCNEELEKNYSGRKKRLRGFKTTKSIRTRVNMNLKIDYETYTTVKKKTIHIWLSGRKSTFKLKYKLRL